jgi:hypothetical protein
LGYKDLATPLAARGIPTVPLRAKSKQAFISGWETLATTDAAQIETWDKQYPDSNCGSVAKAESGGVWFFEFDAPEVAQRVFADTQQKLPDTFKVRSSPGRGHIYFRQTPASIAMGNIAQGFVKGGDWSARVDRQYVVSPGSLHPRTGLPYEIRSLADIVEAPQWFIEWCISQKLNKKEAIAARTQDEGVIPEHFRNETLTSIGGGLREKGLEYPEILAVLLRINIDRCSPPLPESDIETIAGSVSRYKKGKDTTVILPSTTKAATASVLEPGDEPEEAIQIFKPPYPVFPEWVMYGTSIYEGLVKPFCDVNSRYPEFMFMPAVTVLLNYIGTKVHIEGKELNPSIFMVSIGRAGRVIKSSCVQDAIKFFEFMGCVGHGELNVNNANGRAMVFTPASPEGLGKEMNRLNCRNGILFYDELSTLTNKAGIDGSTLSSNLLTLYESGKFQNIVKSAKDSYSLVPGSYCASLIACSTDKNFAMNWSRLAGNSTGLNDRFFFLFQPEQLKDITDYVHVPTQENAARTRQLIDKAIQRSVYRIWDKSPLKQFLKENEDSNRAEIRAEKFALYFAVDLDKEEIDEECLERALALVDYELKVKRYLKVYEAATKEGSIQMEVLYQLRIAGGILPLRELTRLLHPERYGTKLWNDVYMGLIKAGWCVEEGKGTKGDPKRLRALRLPEEDD